MDNEFMYGFGRPVLNGDQVLSPVTEKRLRYIQQIQ